MQRLEASTYIWLFGELKAWGRIRHKADPSIKGPCAKEIRQWEPLKGPEQWVSMTRSDPSRALLHSTLHNSFL